MSLEEFHNTNADVWPEVEENVMNVEIPVDPKFIEEQIEGDPALEDLWQAVQEQSLKYLEIVCQYLREKNKGTDRENREELQTRDEERRRAHLALDDCFNILVRNMRKAGKDITWYDKIESHLSKGIWAIKFSYLKILDTIQQEKPEGR